MIIYNLIRKIIVDFTLNQGKLPVVKIKKAWYAKK